jgi:hypothetical protein
MSASFEPDAIGARSHLTEANLLRRFLGLLSERETGV